MILNTRTPEWTVCMRTVEGVPFLHIFTFLSLGQTSILNLKVRTDASLLYVIIRTHALTCMRTHAHAYILTTKTIFTLSSPQSMFAQQRAGHETVLAALWLLRSQLLSFHLPLQHGHSHHGDLYQKETYTSRERTKKKPWCARYRKDTFKSPISHFHEWKQPCLQYILHTRKEPNNLLSAETALESTDHKWTQPYKYMYKTSRVNCNLQSSSVS